MTYANTPVRTCSNEMNVVKLQRSDRPRVSNQAAVYLPTTQIPQPDHTVCSTASQRSIEHLNSPNEIRRGIHSATGSTPLPVAGCVGCGCLSSSPKHVQCLHATPLDKIPLSECLVCGTRNQSVAAEVESCDFIDMGLERKHRAVLHDCWRRSGRRIRGILESQTVLVFFAVLVCAVVEGGVFGSAEIPEADSSVL